MIWPDDDDRTDGETSRDLAGYLTLVILALLICLLFVACAHAVGVFDEMVGWLYGL
jgi:hypothetical protein